METARVILERGGAVGIFPEGTRVRPGPLGEPQARRRPPRARDRRADRPGRDHRHRGHPPGLADPPAAGDGPLRARADVPPAARRRRHAQELAREVDAARLVLRLAPVGMARRPGRRSATRSSSAPEAGGPRSRRCWRAAARRFSSRAAPPEQAAELRGDCAPTSRYLPGVELPEASLPTTVDRGRLARRRRSSALPCPRRRAARRARRRSATDSPTELGVLVLTKGLVGPEGELPSALRASALGFAAGRLPRRPGHALEAVERGAALVVGYAGPALLPRCSPAHSATAASRATRAPTSSASSSPASRRTPPRSRPAPRSPAAPMPPARRPGASTPSATRWRESRGARHESFAGPGRRRRPGRDRARGAQPQPPRGRAARAAECSPEEIQERARPGARGASTLVPVLASAMDERGRARARHARAGGRSSRAASAAEQLARARQRRASCARGPPERRGRPMHARPPGTLSNGGAAARQGRARPRVLGLLPGAPARRLQLHVLPHRQPPRRRGPHHPDVPAGLPALRARAARVERPAAAAVADPHRAQPRRQLLPRPLAQADVDARGHGVSASRTRPRSWSSGREEAVDGAGGRARAARGPP